MTRVLHIYRTYFPDPPGGLQEAIRQISLATKKEGIDSKVFALSPTPYPNVIHRPEGEVIRARSWVAPASCDIGGMASIFKFRKLADWADILHFHFPWPYADVLNLFSNNKKPKILTYHSDIVRQRLMGMLYQPLMRHTLSSMDAVVVTSPAYGQTSSVIKNFVVPERVRVIPLGIEDEIGDSITEVDNAAVLDRFGLRTINNAQALPYVLALGVLRYYKGLHYLIDAAKEAKGIIVIAGSGPEEEKLKAQALHLGLSNIVFTGRVDEREKAVLLRQCHTLVLSSHIRSEAFGMVLVEASMYSKPMICCEIGSGTSFVNVNGETGFVVRPGNSAELANAINKLLSNPSLAETMGHAARLRYEKLFSGKALGFAYRKLYDETMQKS